MISQYNKYVCDHCGAVSISTVALQRDRCHRCLASLPYGEVIDIDYEGAVCLAVPFSVSRSEMEEEALRWMVKGDYTPDDIVPNSYDCYAYPVLLPVCVFDGTYSGHWQASCGYKREVIYTEYVQRVHYGPHQQSRLVTEPVTRTKTVVDWHPASGVVQGDFSVAIAVTTTFLSDNLAFIQRGDTCERCAFDDATVESCVIEPFHDDDAYQAAVFNKRAKHIVNDIVGEAVVRLIPGDVYKDCRWQFTERHECARVFLPYWLAYYSYDGDDYYLIMDGQSSSRITGLRPVDRRRERRVGKIWRLFNTYLIVFAAVMICSCILPLMAKWGILVFTAILVAGLIPLGVLWHSASEQERKVLKAARSRRRDALYDHLDTGQDYFA